MYWAGEQGDVDRGFQSLLIVVSKELFNVMVVKIIWKPIPDKKYQIFG